MKNIFFLMIALIALGCGQSSKSIVYEKDSVKLKQDFLPGVSGSPSPDTPLKERIQGIWTDGVSENATLQIKADSVFYPDQGKAYKYTLTLDTIRIFYDEYTYEAALSFKKDSLMMDSPKDESLKYWRFKN